MNIGTTTGAIALHLAEAEPMNRSKKDEKACTQTSKNGAGRLNSFKAAAPLIAAIGPKFDQLNIAIKWAAKKAKTM